MKLAAAQIRSTPGDIDKNREKHVDVIRLAVSKGVDGIFFPELSLTGYEPTLASRLAMSKAGLQLDEFKALSNQHGIFIGVGAPTKSEDGIQISMVVFQPGQDHKTYSKQILHSDELAFFTNGNEQLVLKQDNQVLVPAICYESLQQGHAEKAAELGATLYLASVAKSEKGVQAAYGHYLVIAKQHSMTVLMANGVGPADSFLAAGQSAIWDGAGKLVCSANAFEEALVMFDTSTGEASLFRLP
ncbi:carbon-nitrogen hydrolase family protein [Pseudomonas sp.]|uniref:carbon-nitrogen hydrolase family protein n=1 Tax=Pseudomonas sp. TaxID=306 RepID=UPI003D701856